MVPRSRFLPVASGCLVSSSFLLSQKRVVQAYLNLESVVLSTPNSPSFAADFSRCLESSDLLIIHPLIVISSVTVVHDSLRTLCRVRISFKQPSRADFEMKPNGKRNDVSIYSNRDCHQWLCDSDHQRLFDLFRHINVGNYATASLHAAMGCLRVIAWMFSLIYAMAI